MYKLSIQNELYCKAEGSGILFAKKGSMVADMGRFNYSKRLLGTNDGNVVGQVFNHLARRFTGENLEIMEIKGDGAVFLADKASHVTVIDLEPSGAFSSVCVESEDLLAFTQECHYGVTPIGVGVISQKGLFTSKLSYNGHGAQVAIKTQGNPLVLRVQNEPITVDPDAVVAWTGASPKINVNVNWKTLIGQTSGESYFFDFCEPGQIIIVQPFERESGLKIGIDDNRYKPETQSSAYNNTRDNLQDTFGGIMGNNHNQNYNQGYNDHHHNDHHGNNGNNGGGGIGGILGNILNGR